MEEDQIDSNDTNNLDAGELLVSWRVHEYPKHNRSTAWYVMGGMISFGLIVYAVVTANFLFAVIILMIVIITLISSFQEPDEIDVVVTSTGIVVGEAFYGYAAIKDFSIAYQPPDVKYLYIDFYTPWHPVMSLPLENTDPNYVREHLLPFCIENLERDNENFSDAVRRLYKL